MAEATVLRLLLVASWSWHVWLAASFVGCSPCCWLFEPQQVVTVRMGRPVIVEARFVVVVSTFLFCGALDREHALSAFAFSFALLCISRTYLCTVRFHPLQNSVTVGCQRCV